MNDSETDESEKFLVQLGSAVKIVSEGYAVTIIHARSWTTKIFGALYPRRLTQYWSFFCRPSKYIFSRSQSIAD
jgi:hypothetical protein